MKMKKKNKNHFMLNFFQHRKDVRLCDPEINSGRLAGFTLAEVLITLGIIGIVAAMTIPTLMANYQKTQYVTALKKAYAQMTQAIQLLANDNGCPSDLKCLGDKILANGDYSVFGDALVKYFKVAENCKLDTACIEKASGGKHVNSNFDGSGFDQSYGDSFGGYYNFITADGISYSIDNSDCGNQGGWGNHLTEICGDVYVDVNGPSKGPNFWGRDIFYFVIANGGGITLYPSCGADMTDNYWKTNNYCASNNHDEDDACAARIIEEGWQMKY